MSSKLLVLTAIAAMAFSGSALARSSKSGGATLVLTVGPADTEIWIDGQKKGTADKVKEVSLSPGTHDLDFKHKGDEHTDQVTLKKGQKVTFTWKFQDDKPKANPFDDGTGPAPEAQPEAQPQAPATTP